jgi:hypothetical protein
MRFAWVETIARARCHESNFLSAVLIYFSWGYLINNFSKKEKIIGWTSQGFLIVSLLFKSAVEPLEIMDGRY